MMCSAMVRQIIQDPYRMAIIIDNAKHLYARGHNFFIWCDMREIVQIIRDVLQQVGLPVASPEIAHLMGGISDETIKSAQESRIIVATYQYAYRGVSLPKFDAMIFATPRRAKMYQTLKRIFRMGGDTSIDRQIIDIVDSRTNLKNQLYDRTTQYTAFESTVETQKIMFSDVAIPDNSNIVPIINRYLSVAKIK